MTTEPILCTPLTSIDNIKKLMVDHNTKEVLVVDTILEKHLLGVINGDDISEKSVDQSVLPSALNAEQCMKPLIVTVRETSSLEECERLLDENNLESLAIVDEEGHLCGIFDRRTTALSTAENNASITEFEELKVH
jgi:CBS domain-containing protein